MNRSYWMDVAPLRDTLYGKLSAHGMMLSTDTPEVVVERAQTLRNYITNRYQLHYYGYLDGTVTRTPHNRHTVPHRFELTDAGRLRLRLTDTADSVLYPALDAYGPTDGTPVRSFAVWLMDHARVAEDQYFPSRSGRWPLTNHRHEDPARLLVAGTVGPHGSGADLELEGIEDWELGRPLYLPGGQLEFPVRLVHGLEQEYQTASVDYPLLEVSGTHRNVALLGTNGLTEASFTAGYDTEHAYRAFNGYAAGTKVIPETTAQDTYDWTGRSLSTWLQVDFGSPVDGIAGIGVHAGGDYASYRPDLMIMEASDDGESFTEVCRYHRPNQALSLTWFPSGGVSLRYLRIRFEGNRAPSHYENKINVGCVEVYQAGSW